MTNVRLGDPARVTVDAFPDLVLTGHVDSWSPGTGSTFALLPPDNATGNFTKVVQRVPVKIVLDPNPALGTLVRPGMSVEATHRHRPGREPRTHAGFDPEDPHSTTAADADHASGDHGMRLHLAPVSAAGRRCTRCRRRIRDCRPIRCAPMSASSACCSARSSRRWAAG